ncbi:hypothetical protein TNCV_1019071 [Trichonephila clavipes]|nr:hypothetical protein TNCV_1019071 [Trichonephila clavipes]
MSPSREPLKIRRAILRGSNVLPLVWSGNQERREPAEVLSSSLNRGSNSRRSIPNSTFAVYNAMLIKPLTINFDLSSKREKYLISTSHSKAARGLLSTDLVILNHGLVTRMTPPELAFPDLLLTSTPHHWDDVSALTDLTCSGSFYTSSFTS